MPALVVIVIMPPALWPDSASVLLVDTVTSCTASVLGGVVFFWPMPMGMPSTSRSFFRLVPPPKSTLLADQEWYGIISLRELTAEGAISVILNGLRSKRGISSAIFESMVKSRFAELNSTALGVSLTVMVSCSAPGLRVAFTVMSPRVSTTIFS